MRALVYRETGLVLDTNYPQPKPIDGEALIRVLLAGICNTDKKEQVITYRAINTQDIKHEENTSDHLRATHPVSRIWHCTSNSFAIRTQKTLHLP